MLDIEARTIPGILLERYRYEPGPPSDYPAHVHETYQIGVAVDRGGVYEFRGATRPVPTRGLVIVHPGERHAVRDTAPRDEPTRFLMAYIDPSLVRAAAELLPGRRGAEPYFDQPAFDADLVRSFGLLFTADTEWDLARDTRILLLLAGLIERHADERHSHVWPPTAARPALLRARDYLHAHPTENVSLSGLAAVAGLNRHHLIREFARAFGVPPHAYHLQLRVDRARRLLASGMPGWQVALRTGFYDQSHFGRHFRRIAGVPPGRYRSATSS